MLKKIGLIAVLLACCSTALAVRIRCTGCTIVGGQMICERCEIID